MKNMFFESEGEKKCLSSFQTIEASRSERANDETETLKKYREQLFLQIKKSIKGQETEKWRTLN